MTHFAFPDLERRANKLDGLSTTSSTKYDAFKEWLTETFGAAPAVCFLSDLAKQWTSRVGQALMGLPRLLVLLVREGTAEDAAERLRPIHAYVTGLEASVVLVGDEGAWKIALVTGTPGTALYDALHGTVRVDASSTVDESRSRPDFLTLDVHEQAELVWQCLIGRGVLDMDEAIREAAYALREEGFLDVQRVRRDGPAYAAIEASMSSSSRRGVRFERRGKGQVRAFLRDADGFSREHWRDCVWHALGDGAEWVDRDAVVRAAADWAVEAYGLEMQRLRGGGRVDTGIRSAINGLIRMGRIERHGVSLLRRLPDVEQHPVSPPGLSGDDDGGPHDDAPASVSPRPVARGSAPPAAASILTPPEVLLGRLGALPTQAEPALLKLLGGDLHPPDELLVRVRSHLTDFERAFEVHEFLDLGGAERLAKDCTELLTSWPDLGLDGQRIAQAAILYFVESDEADDDFRLGGLKTDQAIMEAVRRHLRARTDA